MKYTLPSTILLFSFFFNIYAAEPNVSYKQPQEQMLKDMHKKQREAINKIKDTLSRNGQYACFTSQNLYNVKGARLLYDKVDIDTPCLANEKYILYKGNIYLVKANIMSLRKRLQEIDSNIEYLKTQINDTKHKIANRQTNIDNNTRWIKRVVGTSASSSEQKYLNSKGEIIGSIQQNTHINDDQKKKIKKLERENKRFDRYNRNDYRRINYFNTQIDHKLALKKKLSNFVSKQEAMRKKAAPGDDDTKKTSNKEIEKKLKLLKDLFDKKLIPQKVYEQKVEKVLKSYI